VPRRGTITATDNPFVEVVEKKLADNRIIIVDGVVGDVMAHEMSFRLRYLASTGKQPITMYFNSVGGDVLAGLAIYDTIRDVNKRAPVSIIANGACMSMGVIILQAASTRLSTPNTHFMLHELAMRNEGKLSEQKDAHQHALRLQNQLNDIIAGRTGMTRKVVEKLTERKDYYIDPVEALKLKLIDGIVGA